MVDRPSKVDSGMASANWCIFGWLLGLAQLLLHGALGLVLFLGTILSRRFWMAGIAQIGI